MVKLILFIMVLATGQLGQLELKTPYDTVEACEAAKPEQRAKLMAYLVAQHRLTKEDVIVGLECNDLLSEHESDKKAGA